MTRSKSSRSEADAPYLEDLLEALQKTFSRLSSRTAEVRSSMPAAMITGPVRFTMKLRLEPDSDHFRAAPDGPVEITLEGEVEPDVRYEEKPPEA